MTPTPGKPGTTTSADGRVCHVVTQTVPFPPSFMCDVAADVAEYRHFLPFCSDSVVKPATEQFADCVHAHPHPIPALAASPYAPRKAAGPGRMFEADLHIGYGAFSMAYSSLVTVQAPFRVLSEALPARGSVFSHLVSQWEFSPAGNANNNANNANNNTEAQQCTIHFTVDFKVSSPLYAGVVKTVFAEIAKKQLDAFVGRARKIYPAWRAKQQQQIQKQQQSQQQAQQQASVSASSGTISSPVGTQSLPSATIAAPAASAASAAVGSGASMAASLALSLWQRQASFADDQLAALVNEAIAAVSSSGANGGSAGDGAKAVAPTAFSLTPARVASLSLRVPVAASSVRTPLEGECEGTVDCTGAPTLGGLFLNQAAFTSLCARANSATLAPDAVPLLRRFRERYIIKAAAESPAVAAALWEFVVALSPTARTGAHSASSANAGSASANSAGSDVSVRIDDALCALYTVTRASTFDRVMALYLALLYTSPSSALSLGLSRQSQSQSGGPSGRPVTATASAARVKSLISIFTVLHTTTVRHVAPRMVVRRAQRLRTAAAAAAAPGARALEAADALPFALGDSDARARAFVASASESVSPAVAAKGAPRVVEALALMGAVVGETEAAARALPALVCAALPTVAGSAAAMGEAGEVVAFGEGEWAAAWGRAQAAELVAAIGLQGVEGLVDWALAESAADRAIESEN